MYYTLSVSASADSWIKTQRVANSTNVRVPTDHLLRPSTSLIEMLLSAWSQNASKTSSFKTKCPPFGCDQLRYQWGGTQPAPMDAIIAYSASSAIHVWTCIVYLYSRRRIQYYATGAPFLTFSMYHCHWQWYMEKVTFCYNWGIFLRTAMYSIHPYLQIACTCPHVRT